MDWNTDNITVSHGSLLQTEILCQQQNRKRNELTGMKKRGEEKGVKI